MEKTDCDGLHAVTFQLSNRRPECLFIQRKKYFSCIQGSLLRLTPQVPRNQCFCLFRMQIIELIPVLPSDLKNIAKPVCRDQSSDRPRPLQQSICRHRGSMRHSCHTIRGKKKLLKHFSDSFHYSHALIRGRGRQLFKIHFPFLTDRNHICKCSSHVYTNLDSLHVRSSSYTSVC